MSKLNMVLTPKDEDKINLLKDKYGLTQNTELIRFLITYMADQVRKELESQK
jgi:hypothetical protein